MQLRTISRMIVIALVALVGAVALIHQRLAYSAANSPNPTSASAALAGGDPLNQAAPAMSLRDQNGALVTTQSLQGRPAIITFMDMTCTQECPIEAQFLNQTAQFMGAANARKVSWIVVSVNPNNTPADTASFIKKNSVTVPVKVLMGSQSQLKPVWDAYHIAVQPTPTDVNHTVALYILDRTGRERMVFPEAFDPKTLSQDLMTLLASK